MSMCACACVDVCVYMCRDTLHDASQMPPDIPHPPAPCPELQGAQNTKIQQVLN